MTRFEDAFLTSDCLPLKRKEIEDFYTENVKEYRFQTPEIGRAHV